MVSNRAVACLKALLLCRREVSAAGNEFAIEVITTICQIITDCHEDVTYKNIINLVFNLYFCPNLVEYEICQ